MAYATKNGASKYGLLNIGILALTLSALLVIYMKDTTVLHATLFEREETSYKPYFKDTFDEYGQYSEVLDSSSEDLTRFQNGGAITAFAQVTNWRSISKMNLQLTDASGKSALIEGVENIEAPRETNMIKSNDSFPDYTFSCTDQPVTSWEDFMLVDGESFVFWEIKKPLDIDMAHIVSWKAVDAKNEALDVPLTDVVAHEGLCKNKNSTHGAWYTPNGLPQYGVWWPQNGKLVMKKVPQEQYPSNGDHTRILSSFKTPANFLMRVKFTVTDMPTQGWFSRTFKGVDTSLLKNTYIRIGWDFDDVYDPGHDQTLIYDALEYGYLGLQRVYPIERYFVQGYEPDENNQNAKTSFSFENGHTYELIAKVEGQQVTTEVYDVGAFYESKVAEVSYTFSKPRPTQGYPFSIEATGNTDLSIDEIEVKSK